MTTVPKHRRVSLVVAVLLLGLLALLAGGRQYWVTWALETGLRRAGAEEIGFNVTQVSPGRIEIADLHFRVRALSVSIRRVTSVRDHWWTPSLGVVRVEEFQAPLTIDDSDTNPWAWATYRNGGSGSLPVKMPVEQIFLDGQVLVQAAALKDQAVSVKVEISRLEGDRWSGMVRADGAGLVLRATGELDPAAQALIFELGESAVDLAVWQGFVQRLVLFPGGALELAGKITADAKGRYAGKTLNASGQVRLRDGSARNAARGVTATGIEADLAFADFARFQSKPGTLRVSEIRVGQLVLRDVAAGFAFAGPAEIDVSQASLQALGGRVAAEPFKYFLNLRELEAVLSVDGISVAEVMALTPDLPAKASGQVNGRLPIRIDSGGLRLGSGWLELRPGVYAEVQFKASGLLTGGLAAGSPSYAVLQKIEAGLLKLKLTTLRLEVRPPDAPAGRSARLHLEGEPVDREVKAPVILDLNVNGPIERLLDLGLDSRVSFSGKQ